MKMSREAELNVIGSLLIDNDCMNSIYNMLESNMFTNDLLGRFYLEFQRGYDNGYEVNVPTLIQKMYNSDYTSDVIKDELLCCGRKTVTSATVKSYAEQIHNEHKARLLNRIINHISVNPETVNQQIAQILVDLEDLRENEQSKLKTLSAVAKENKDKYFKDIETDKLYLGFPQLDDMLGGLEGGDMIVIGARPGVGKSAFVTQITTSLAGDKKRIGFYNLEMQEKQMYERFMVSESGIGLTRLRRAKSFVGDEEQRFNKANEIIEGRTNVFISTGSKSMRDIRSESRHMDYDIIIIDYLQLLTPDKSYRGNRTAEVGEISRAVKKLAMELDIPVIALSQMNRLSEMTDTKEPTMAELREAGNIEQDASVIILMWNLSKEDPTKKGCKVEKQRQGKCGKSVLNFNGELMKFEETGESIKEAKKWAKASNDDCPFN